MRGYPEHLHEIVAIDTNEDIYDRTLEEFDNVDNCCKTCEYLINSEIDGVGACASCINGSNYLQAKGVK